MGTFDDWERWLHLGGVADIDERDAHDSHAASDADGALRSPVVEIDDPWGALDVALTPLTEAQREHLRLAAPTVLDELGELERHRESDEDLHEHDVSGELSEELTSAFKALDAIEPHTDEDRR